MKQTYFFFIHAPADIFQSSVVIVCYEGNDEECLRQLGLLQENTVD